MLAPGASRPLETDKRDGTGRDEEAAGKVRCGTMSASSRANNETQPPALRNPPEMRCATAVAAAAAADDSARAKGLAGSSAGRRILIGLVLSAGRARSKGIPRAGGCPLNNNLTLIAKLGHERAEKKRRKIFAGQQVAIMFDRARWPLNKNNNTLARPHLSGASGPAGRPMAEESRDGRRQRAGSTPSGTFGAWNPSA